MTERERYFRIKTSLHIIRKYFVLERNSINILVQRYFRLLYTDDDKSFRVPATTAV